MLSYSGKANGYPTFIKKKKKKQILFTFADWIVCQNF